MAHFWKRTTFGQVDMSYTLDPAITIADPRPALPAAQQRDALIKAVLDEFQSVRRGRGGGRSQPGAGA
jgi:hypothetical protein